MPEVSELTIQYITDQTGKKTAVILPIAEFEELLEDIADLAAVVERRDEPGIDSQPNVCGGDPCIARTRIPVWVLVQSIQSGVSEADLLYAYPTLRAEDLANAWAYFRTHREEIERQIQENEEA